MDLMDIRRSIIFDTPHKEATSGNPAIFFTDRAGKAKSCIVKLTPMQSGSGIPSTTNIRNFINHDGVSLINNGVVTHYQYGLFFSGYIDIVSGYFYSFDAAEQTNGNGDWSVVADHKFYKPLGMSNRAASSSSFAEQCCNMYPFGGVITGWSTSVTEDKHFYIQRSSDPINHPEWNRIWVYDTDYTLDSFKAMLNENPLQYTYPIAGVSLKIASSWVKTHKGYNNFSSPDGEIYYLQYWTKNTLPSGYKQVESIWSYKYGGQVDTGVTGNDDTLKIEASFKIDFFQEYAFLFGNHQTENSNCWRLLLGPKDDGMLISTSNRKASGGGIYLNPPNGYKGRRLIVTLTHNETTVLDVDSNQSYSRSSSDKPTGTENNSTICIGNGNVSPNSSFNTNQLVSWYGFRICRNNELIRDYVPCVRTSDNKVGFYDRVNYTFNPSIAKSEFFAN